MVSRSSVSQNFLTLIARYQTVNSKWWSLGRKISDMYWCIDPIFARGRAFIYFGKGYSVDFLFLLQVYDLEGQALKKCISKAIKIFNGIHGRMMKKNLENFKNSTEIWTMGNNCWIWDFSYKKERWCDDASSTRITFNCSVLWYKKSSILQCFD